MELYPPDTEYDGRGLPYIYCYSYQPMWTASGRCYPAKSQGYQGDTYAVIEKDKKFGLLVLAGVMSGCDALQGAGLRRIDLIEKLRPALCGGTACPLCSPT
jgi:hypothetical protein